MLKEGKQCSSTHTKMGDANNAGECAQKVKEAGGAFFIFSNDVMAHKGCYKENTLTATCDGYKEKWEDVTFDFFKIKGKF